jgi:hypothetical protein
MIMIFGKHPTNTGRESGISHSTGNFIETQRMRVKSESKKSSGRNFENRGATYRIIHLFSNARIFDISTVQLKNTLVRTILLF